MAPDWLVQTITNRAVAITKETTQIQIKGVLIILFVETLRIGKEDGGPLQGLFKDWVFVHFDIFIDISRTV